MLNMLSKFVQKKIVVKVITLLNINIRMGCAVSNTEARKYLKTPTLFGELKVTILSCHLDRNTNSVMKMDPYVKLVMSNQIKKTEVIKKGGFDPHFDYQCSFFVNSCYKPYGRSLEIFVMDKNMIASDKVIGYGLMDLDPIIKQGQQVHEIKVRLSFQCGEVGVIKLRLQFIEHPHHTISFRFQSLDITKRTNIVGTMNCWIKLTVGEEVMQTQKAKDIPQCPPIWKDEILVMEIPNCIPNILIEAFDQKKFIGKEQFPVESFIDLNEQKLFKEIIKGEDKNGTAIIEFSTICGPNAQLAPAIQGYKKHVQPVQPEVKRQQPQVEQKNQIVVQQTLRNEQIKLQVPEQTKIQKQVQEVREK